MELFAITRLQSILTATVLAAAAAASARATDAAVAATTATALSSKSSNVIVGSGARASLALRALPLAGAAQPRQRACAPTQQLCLSCTEAQNVPAERGRAAAITHVTCKLRARVRRAAPRVFI